MPSMSPLRSAYKRRIQGCTFSSTYSINLAKLQALLQRSLLSSWKILPMNMQDTALLGRGATGTVYRLSDSIVVKMAREGDDEQIDHANEQRIFEMIEECPGKIPHLIECYHRVPGLTFLELAPNGSLAMLLNQYQKRDVENNSKILEISQALDPQDIGRWMEQLCTVAVAFERLGLVHGDIRPGNMLLDAGRNLKLADLDRGMKLGEDIDVLTEPFGRLLNKSEGIDAGTYGKAGARTETFAIGSVFYSLLRGYEPYETQWWGDDDHFVILSEKLQRGEFPPLDESAEDNIIRKCWHGEYGRVSQLLADVSSIIRKTRRNECEKFIESGGLQMSFSDQRVRNEEWILRFINQVV